MALQSSMASPRWVQTLQPITYRLEPRNGISLLLWTSLALLHACIHASREILCILYILNAICHLTLGSITDNSSKTPMYIIFLTQMGRGLFHYVEFNRLHGKDLPISLRVPLWHQGGRRSCCRRVSCLC